MANDPAAALVDLDDAITLLDAEDYPGSKASVEAARAHITDVPALVGYFDAYLDTVPASHSDAATPSGEFAWSIGTDEAGRGIPVDRAHALKVLRGRVALNDSATPVFGADGS